MKHSFRSITKKESARPQKTQAPHHKGDLRY